MSHGVGSKGKKPKKSFKKDPLKVAGPSHDNGTRQKEHNGPKCYFCRGYGHLQKNCPKRRAWFEKKGKLLAYVCFESNMTQVPSNTWWIDSGYVALLIFTTMTHVGKLFNYDIIVISLKCE